MTAHRIGNETRRRCCVRSIPQMWVVKQSAWANPPSKHPKKLVGNVQYQKMTKHVSFIFTSHCLQKTERICSYRIEGPPTDGFVAFTNAFRGAQVLKSCGTSSLEASAVAASMGLPVSSSMAKFQDFFCQNRHGNVVPCCPPRIASWFLLICDCQLVFRRGSVAPSWIFQCFDRSPNGP
jgi:hypothetical protein